MSVNWKENILELCQVNQISQIGGATQEQAVSPQGDINELKVLVNKKADKSELNSYLLKTDRLTGDNVIGYLKDYLTNKAYLTTPAVDTKLKAYLKIDDAPNQGELDKWRRSLISDIDKSRELQTSYQTKVNEYIAETRTITDNLKAKDIETNSLLEQLKTNLGKLQEKDTEITTNLNSLKTKDAEINGLLKTLGDKDKEFNSKIAAIETRIGSSESKQSGIEGLSGRVANIETKLEGIVALLSKLR